MSKTSGKFCLVYYYVPEDKDDPEFPNAFGVNLAVEEVKVSDIRKLFPLEGDYTFRFKAKVGNANVWVDIKEDAKIPLFGGKIVMKASRISWESKVDRHRVTPDRVREESKSTSSASNSIPQEPTYVAQPKQENLSQKQDNTFGSDDINFLGSTFSSTSSATTATQNQGSYDNHDLLNFSHPPNSASTNSYKVNQNASKKDDLMSFDNLF